MANFRLNDFINGVPAKTMDGSDVKFIHLSKDNIPAKLLVEVEGSMEYYYENGTWLNNGIENERDIVMNSLSD